MTDQLIGKSEVTWELVNALENLADAQQQCEAQFVAAIYHKRALDDRRVDVSKAFDACRKFECLDVDKMMEQKFVVTSQMIDAYRAELLGQTSAPVSADADELNDLTPHEGEEEGDPPMPEGEGWKRNAGEQPFEDEVLAEVVLSDGSYDIDWSGDLYWHCDCAQMTPIIWYRKAPQEATQSETEQSDGMGSQEVAEASQDVPETESEAIQPAPAPETFDHAAEATAQIEASIDEREEAAAPAYDVGQKVTFEDDDGATLSGEISKVSQDFSTHEPFYNIDVLNENGVRESYFQVDHDRVTPIEAQAETESIETEAQPLGFDLPEGAVKNGIGYDQYTGWYADYTVPETGASGRVYATEVGIGDFQLDLNSHSEPSPHTEQPETVEAEPEAPDEPKAERKTLDCTGDFTQEEIVAKSGFDPRVQSDDIAAAEREEFNRPRVYNPWAPPAKAEG